MNFDDSHVLTSGERKCPSRTNPVTAPTMVVGFGHSARRTMAAATVLASRTGERLSSGFANAARRAGYDNDDGLTTVVGHVGPCCARHR